MSDPRGAWRNLISRSERNLGATSQSLRMTIRRHRGGGKDNDDNSRRRRHRSLDNAMGMIDEETTSTNPTPVTPNNNNKNNKRPPTPTQKRSRTPSSSLLQRFLQSTSRRRSLPGSASIEGSTVSRMTDDGDSAGMIMLEASAATTSPTIVRRRNTMDGDLVPDVEQSTSSSSPPMGIALPSPRALLRGPVQVIRRRTMDLGRSSSSSTSSRSPSSDRPMTVQGNGGGPQVELNYVQAQEFLRRRAEDLHKGGQLDEAIKVWVQALVLADRHQDSLANKTELLCILVDMHLQAAQRQDAVDAYDYDDQDDIAAAAASGNRLSSNNNNINNSSMDPSDIVRGADEHRQAAKRYVHRIKPAVVKPQWLHCNRETMEFFCHAEAWELACVVAEQLATEGTENVESRQLATMHFQVASLQLDSNRHGEALQHLQATVLHLQQIPVESRDMTMYQQVLQLLATEYNSHSQHALALDAYTEQVAHAPRSKLASLYCQKAQAYIKMQQLDQALEHLEAAGKYLDDADTNIQLQLLQTKGDLYCRMGRMEESYQAYLQALKEVVNPAEKAKLLYTMGRLCVRLKRIREAIGYYTREMEITAAELGHSHLSVSRILHEVAKLYDEYLGEHKMALLKLNKALSIEICVLQDTHAAIPQCSKCNPVTHRMCAMHANLQRDLSNQIRETKRAQGQLHFKLGDFEKAMKSSDLSKLT